MRAAAQRRSLGLVFTLVFALIGAPASSALRSECDLCPKQCPMHRDRDEAPADHGKRLKCHMAPGAGEHGDHHAAEGTTAQPKGPSLARGTCGNHGVVPATVLPPMLLPALLAQLVTPAVQRAPIFEIAGQARNADPPDTPPPIAAA